MAPPRTYSIAEAADAIGYSVSALCRHRVDDRIIFDDGNELRLIRLGRRMRVPAVELDRLLGQEVAQSATQPLQDEIGGWPAVGEAVRERLNSMALTITDLAERSGLSRETVRPVMAGAPNTLKAASRAKISVALGWTAESIDRIRNGGLPSELAAQVAS